MKLDDALKDVSSIAFDTSPIIYFVEANPKYDAVVTDVFTRIEEGSIIGVTSVISLCEVLVQPIRSKNQILQALYRETLVTSQHFFTKNIDPAIAETAATLRAKYNLRTPDAMQIATAIESKCQVFLCNDKLLRRVEELRICVLDELEL